MMLSQGRNLAFNFLKDQLGPVCNCVSDFLKAWFLLILKCFLQSRLYLPTFTELVHTCFGSLVGDKSLIFPKNGNETPKMSI